MYYNGAEGDQAPIGQGGGKSPHEKEELYGRAIAIDAMKVYHKINPRENVKFDYSYHNVTLPERKVHPNFMKTGGEEYNLTPEVVHVILNVMAPKSTGIGAIRLGGMLIVGAPGELTAGLGLQIKSELKAHGIKYPVIGGLANEWISYILTADRYKNGAGYESSVSFYGEGLGEVIVKGMLDTALPLAK